MKPSHDLSLSRTRTCALALALIAGSSTVLAQGGGAGTQNYGTERTGAPGAAATTGTSINQKARHNAETDATGNRRDDGGTATSGSYGAATENTQTQAPGLNPAREAMETGRLGWSDRRFVHKASDSGMTELSLAQLASQKASDPEVRDFAQQLIQDHQAVNIELMALANRNDVKVDLEDPTKERAYRRLTRAPANEFDREFIAQMVEMHESDVERFEKAAEDADSQAIRQFASQHVAHLREHLQKAQELQQTLMPTGREQGWTLRSTGSESTRGTTGSGRQDATSSGSRQETGAPTDGSTGSSRNKDRTTP